MRAIVLDAETHWSAEFSLRRMSTEEYIADPRFTVHGWAVREAHAGHGADLRAWMDHRDFTKWARQQDWGKIAIIGHNLRFDAAILAWRYRILPRFYIDTLSLANVHIRPYTQNGRASLDACCEFMGLPTKSGVLQQVKGITTADLLRNPPLWHELGIYALQDADNALAIFQKYWPKTPDHERLIMNWCIKAWLHARLALDVDLLQKHLQEVEDERQLMLMMSGLDDPKLLRSRVKFAAHLSDTLGITVDTKASKSGDIPAIGKDDDFMRSLVNHENPEIRYSAQARLAWSSNLEITRTKRFLAHAKITHNRLCVPLQYGAAHTLRFGGSEHLNLQNLGRKSKLRRAIKARAGRKLVIGDLAQIECRLAGWFAKCRRLLDEFRNPEIDVYCSFGEGIFNIKLSKEHTPVERQISKVSVLQLGYQSGAQKLYDTLRKDAVPVTFEQCADIVTYYRKVAYPEIRNAWYDAERTLKEVIESQRPRGWRGCEFRADGITVPSGGWLPYPKLTLNSDGVPIYWSARYSSWQQLYGGKIMENLCQRTARDVITETHLKFLDEAVLQVHDELVLDVPEEKASWYRDAMKLAMQTTPAYLPDLPLDAEVKISSFYDKG